MPKSYTNTIGTVCICNWRCRRRFRWFGWCARYCPICFPWNSTSVRRRRRRSKTGRYKDVNFF